MPLVGATLPQEVPAVIEARRFLVRDAQGQVGAGMGQRANP